MADARGTVRVAVDAVVFTIQQDQLKLLLIQRKNPPFQGMYALPGGFIHPAEALEAAAHRELSEETGVKDIFLTQLGAYGAVKRDPRGRIISIAYLALIKGDQRLKPATDASAAQWLSIHQLPTLAFDHAAIIADALKRLHYEIQMTTLASQILPSKFTLTQLQHLYELILGRNMDKRNFRKWIKELDLVQELPEWTSGKHRPAQLYRFKISSYQQLGDRVNLQLI
ncbi:NUDIX hydrolase [Candidatus Woesearchaeota archaeon]|nr:NUDIX hydrolase [Candidatus Woesearchaeota archaeon]